MSKRQITRFTPCSSGRKKKKKNSIVDGGKTNKKKDDAGALGRIEVYIIDLGV